MAEGAGPGPRRPIGSIPFPGPTQVTVQAGSGDSRTPSPRGPAGVSTAPVAAAPEPLSAPRTIAPVLPKNVVPGPDTRIAGALPSASGARITEIVPPASGTAIGAQAAAARSAGMSPIGGVAPLAGADSCVNVFVRSANVDGREVVSVDLHGDGLIKGAVAPHLAGELLSRAGPPAGGARAACVPTALAQSLFDPVINLAAADPAVRIARVGDRWVLAGREAPAQSASPQSERVQLAAAATTRGAPKAKRSPTKPRPIQVSYNTYP